jgi:hypothetical protein
VAAGVGAGRRSALVCPPCYASPRRFVLRGGNARVKSSCNAKEGCVRELPRTPTSQEVEWIAPGRRAEAPVPPKALIASAQSRPSWPASPHAKHRATQEDPPSTLSTNKGPCGGQPLRPRLAYKSCPGSFSMLAITSSSCFLGGEDYLNHRRGPTCYRNENLGLRMRVTPEKRTGR